MTTEQKGFNPTCILTGKKDNLVMHAHRNDKGDMVGWIFLHEDLSNCVDDYEIKIFQKAANPTTHLLVLIFT